jgi:hypothetical protein
MKILFWNVQRLGSGTPTRRKEVFEAVFAEAVVVRDVEYALFCEISASLIASDGNTINKQLMMAKRTKKKSSGQLGYAGLTADMTELPLVKADLPSHDEVFGMPSWRKGGNYFDRISKRMVGHVGKLGGRDIYCYHANASALGGMLVAWAAAHLHQKHKGKFVLLGDLNAEPGNVQTQLQWRKIDPGHFVCATGGSTHNAKTDLKTTYDYAIGGNGHDLQVTALNIRDTVREFTRTQNGVNDGNLDSTTNENMSDHLPIIVEF